MKLSGHNYDNDVLNSLLDNLKGDVVYTGEKVQKSASKVQPVSGTSIFSSTTEDDFQNILEEELQDIAGELTFAADRAKVSISQEDLRNFVKQAKSEELRGKALERAAQKFCSKLVAATAPPMSTTRNIHSPNLLDNANDKAVIPAGYDVKYGQNDTTTGGYMGQSKNPNTIWDSEAMQRLAVTPSNDERMKAEKEANEKLRDDQKQKKWETLQSKMSEENVIHEKTASVANVSTKEGIGDQKLPANSMSIFNDDRDFGNIPEKTAGETIKESAEERSMKKTASKDEWNQIEGAHKTDNSNLSVFETEESTESVRKNLHRESVDSMFEGLADSGILEK